jgi:hypothetical protein
VQTAESKTPSEPPPEPPSKAEHKRAIGAAGATLLALAARTRRTLATTVDAVAFGPVAAQASPALAAVVVGGAARNVVLRARAVTREQSRLAFERQTGLDVNKLLKASAGADEQAAGAAARSASNAYKKALVEASDEAETIAEARKAVDIRATLDRIASDEVLTAWNEEHREAARAADRAGHTVISTWNAELDARTCERCADVDGAEVFGDEDFADGDPPLHSHCHCYVTTRFEDA